MTELTISDYRILYDRQADGYRSSSGTCDYHGGILSLTFQYASDGACDAPQYLVQSRDLGRTWTDPVVFGPPVRSIAEQFQVVCYAGRTARGTLILAGFFIPKGVKEDSQDANETLRWRPSEVLIGRQERGQPAIGWTRFPSGSFLGEQYAYPGLFLADGRVVLSIWGSAGQGQNWQCGVLLSDDDGCSWRYRQVGFEPDLAIRHDPLMPAGFNEQTLFECPDGKLVSIIRGREKLGGTDATGEETYFFRSESSDGGEHWRKPEPTNLPGTGAALTGLSLPDGSLLQAARIPYPRARAGFNIPDEKLHGLHLVRSFDLGRTWRTEAAIQHDPLGKPFDYYYNAMNGQFVRLDAKRWLYAFGHFDYLHKLHPMLSLTLSFSQHTNRRGSIVQR